MLGFTPLASAPLAAGPDEGLLAILGVLYVNPDTFGTAVLTPGAVSISGTLYIDADTFGAHTVASTYTIAGVHYSDPDTFGAATIAAGAVTITGALYADADTFGSATLVNFREIRAVLFIDADTFGAARIVGQVLETVAPGEDRCMRCGFIRGNSRLRREWTGLIVCRDTCWEPRHPQDFVRGKVDHQAPPWVRPEPAPIFLSPGDVTAEDL